MLQSIQSYVSQLLRQLNREYIRGVKFGSPITNRKDAKKMNEYLLEMMLSQEDNLSDEEIMIMNSYQKVRINRKKNKQKENYIHGEESNYNLYSI